MAIGVLLSLMASSLFAVMYYYTTLLTPLSSEQIYSWRMLLTIPLMGLMIAVLGQWSSVKHITQRLKTEPQLYIVLPLSAALLAAQLWLFMWAPAHGKALEVSLGYFMLPLTMIIMGRIVYKEKLSSIQKIATACATLGVLYELIRVGTFSWTSALVCSGYPIYFYLRYRFKTNNLGGMWFDMLLTLPLVIYFLSRGPNPLSNTLHPNPTLGWLILGLGLISASALVCYISASHRLPFSLFGLLSYVEPVLLVFVSILIGESIQQGEWPTYIAIWLALLLLAFESGFKIFNRSLNQTRASHSNPTETENLIQH